MAQANESVPASLQGSLADHILVEPDQQERIFIPPLNWTVVNRPAPRRGDDFHHTGEGLSPNGSRVASVIVTDSPDSGGVPFARKFAESFISSVQSGDTIGKVIKRSFGSAFAGARITYPAHIRGNYTIETINHVDCFIAALTPTLQKGQIIYKPRVYPITVADNPTTVADSLPAGTVILNGSDGSVIYLAEYLKSTYDRLYHETKDETYLKAWDRVDELPELFQETAGNISRPQQSEAVLMELLERLVALRPIEQGSETEWVEEVRKGMEEGIGIGPDRRQKDDVTLLMAHLPTPRRAEVAENPQGDYDLEDLIAASEQALCNIEIDPDSGNITGKILGCEANYVLHYIIDGIFPSTRIPISLKLEDFFKDADGAFMVRILSKAIHDRDFEVLKNKKVGDFFKKEIPRYLKKAIIQPLLSLRSADPDSARQVASFPPETTDMLTGSLADEQKAWQMAGEYGNISWNDLESPYKRILSMFFGEPKIIPGAQIICYPPERWNRMCPSTEDQFESQITVNRVIHTSHLEWTNAVATELVVGENGGVIFPDVLMLPSGATAVALGIAYMHKYSEDGSLRNINNLNLPTAVFRPDRPIQEEQLQNIHQRIKVQ